MKGCGPARLGVCGKEFDGGKRSGVKGCGPARLGVCGKAFGLNLGGLVSPRRWCSALGTRKSVWQGGEDQ